MQKIKRTFGFIFTHPLAKKHPLQSLFRFLFWQLQCRLQPSKLLVKPFLHNVKFYACKGLSGITGNIYTGLHEFNDMAFLLHFLKTGDVFLDIGANAGSYTLLASGVCKARTFAIEASAATVAITQKNIALNQLQNHVVLINSAAGARTGTINFSRNRDATNHVVLTDDLNTAETETVNLIRMDDLTTENQPAMVKIDVEGFETEVLAGMTETLKRTSLKAMIIELNGSGQRYGFADEPIDFLLRQNGFKPYRYDAFSRCLSLLDTYGKTNTIYCRDLKTVNSRLKQGRFFRLMGENI